MLQTLHPGLLLGKQTPFQAVILVITLLILCTILFLLDKPSNSVLTALREVKQVLGRLVERVAGTEKEINAIKKNLQTCSSSDSSNAKHTVLLIVRVSKFYTRV